MTQSQESRVSSTQDNFRLSEESRSGVSALVSRLNSSALGVDHVADNEKLRGDLAKMKEQKMQDPFPWMAGFCTLCQTTVGSRNVRHLENLMNVYLENVTPNVKDCYTKPNRAAKLKKSMNDTLIFFHLFYQDIKETLEHSFYLERMTPLVSMFMDMEIKASLRGKESLKKVASRLTSSLYIFLDNSEEHMLDAILMTKFIHKNYHQICHPLLWKLLNSISTYPMYEMLYVRCLLTFKRWKKIVPDAEERKRINKDAVQKLHPPPNFMENIKTMGNVLPRIPKTKKNITLFLMQSNFNLKNACLEFLKSVKKSQKSAYTPRLDVEIDKPLFFSNRSGDSSPRLPEKEDESDSGCSNNLIDDIWSSISTVESKIPQTKGLKDLASEEPVVDSAETPKKNKKAEKKGKKGKKLKAVKCVGAKKKSLSLSEKSDKQVKKLSKLKGKKKRKKKVSSSNEIEKIKVKQNEVPKVEECYQAKVMLASSEIEEHTQVPLRPNSPVGEFNQIRVAKRTQVRSDLPPAEEAQIKPWSEEIDGQGKVNDVSSQNGDPSQEIQAQVHANECDQLKDENKSQVEEHKAINESVFEMKERGQVTGFEVKSQVDTCNQMEFKKLFTKVEESVFKEEISVLSEEFSSSKNTQIPALCDDSNQAMTKIALLSCEESNKGTVIQASPLAEECNLSKMGLDSTHRKEAKRKSCNSSFLQVSDQIMMPQAIPKTDECDAFKIDSFEEPETKDTIQVLFPENYHHEMVKTKTESSFDIPKTEKCDSPPSGDHVLESELLDSNLKPLVKKMKVEVVNNGSAGSQFESSKCVTSESVEREADPSNEISSKAIDYSKSLVPLVESVASTDDSVSKSVQKDDCIDKTTQDLFTIDSTRDALREKDSDKHVDCAAVVANEGKSLDICRKSQSIEAAVSDSGYGEPVSVCNFSPKQGVCETSTSEPVPLEKMVTNDNDEEVAILRELKHQPSKCDASGSEEEIVLSDEGDMNHEPTQNMFNSRNEEVVKKCIEGIISFPERQYTLAPNEYSEVSIDFETDNPPLVSDDLEPEQTTNLAIEEVNFFKKTNKDDSPCFPEEIDVWMHDINLQNNPSKTFEPVMPHPPQQFMEDDDYSESEGLESITPTRGMGKMSYHETLYCSRQKEYHASTYGRLNCHSYSNSAERGIGDSESFPMYSHSGSGSSSPRSDSQMDVVESVGQESMETSESPIKTPEHEQSSVSVESVPDTTSPRYYNLPCYYKSPETVSCEKETDYKPQVICPPKIGDNRLDKACVVVEPMDHSLLSRVNSDRCHTLSVTPETSSCRSVSEGSSQKSTLKLRKTSSKSLPQQTVDSQTSPGKHGTGEYPAAQSSATIRGRRRRGRPPSRGRGVSSSSKMATDSKSARKQGYSGKGRNDPEFQIATAKISQPYDPPLTRSISKKFGISETDNMFDRL